MTVNRDSIDQAAEKLTGVAENTPLEKCKRLSNKFSSEIYFKREDLQEVRSFKIRGAYNKISTLDESQQEEGVVCASAGNHAQGVAYGCKAHEVDGVIFMPSTTPNQKIEKVERFGGEFIDIKLEGNNFDQAKQKSLQYCRDNDMNYVHPFNDKDVISGQGTIGKEIYEELGDELDIILVPVGGGGLISGISSYIKAKTEDITVLGVEPQECNGMHNSIDKGRVVPLQDMSTFVDGVAVAEVGDITFEITKENVDQIIHTPEGQVCTTMIELYQNEGIIAEPAGALSIAALEEIKSLIDNKTVACILSGGNNDILRYPEILEKSLIYQGLKHYFIVNFAQKPGQLKKFVNNALGPNDDIVRFEYIKKNNKERGPALIGIELQDQSDFQPLIDRMDEYGINYRLIDNGDILYDYLI